MKKRKILAMLLAAGMMIGCLAGCGGSAGAEEESTDTQAASTGAYPEKDISGIIHWGAGGGTDSLMRPLATLAEAQLGVSIVVENKTGGTGSIATQYVYDQAADGYTLLMGAENPQLYSALDILELTPYGESPLRIVEFPIGVLRDEPSAEKN